MGEQGRRFDAIVLDLPKFAPSVAHASVPRGPTKTSIASRSSCFARVACSTLDSCSGGISADLFHKIVASAGCDAGVDGYIVERLGRRPTIR